MSYDYDLYKLKYKEIDALKEVRENVVDQWGFDLNHVQKIISNLYPILTWESSSQLEKKIYGQITDSTWGRFECSVDLNVPFILISTSRHIDYKNMVIEIARALNLSAFDAQTGKRIYTQS